MQDYIAMVLLWYATQVSGTGTSQPAALPADLQETLQKMEQQLDRVL
jgi:hypothetical protein